MGEKRPGDSGPSAGVARLFFPACLSGQRSVGRRPRLAPIASIPSLIRRPPRHCRSARPKLTATRPPIGPLDAPQSRSRISRRPEGRAPRLATMILERDTRSCARLPGNLRHAVRYRWIEPCSGLDFIAIVRPQFERTGRSSGDLEQRPRCHHSSFSPN
jgi:hypothetical protein